MNKFCSILEDDLENYHISLKQNREHCVLVMLSFSTSSLSDYCSPSSNIYLKWLRSHLKRYSEGCPSSTDSLRATKLLNLGWKTDAAGRKVGIDFKIQSCGYQQVLVIYGVYLLMGYTFVLIHRGTVEAIFPRKVLKVIKGTKQIKGKAKKDAMGWIFRRNTVSPCFIKVYISFSSVYPPREVNILDASVDTKIWIMSFTVTTWC